MPCIFKMFICYFPVFAPFVALAAIALLLLVVGGGIFALGRRERAHTPHYGIL